MRSYTPPIDDYRFLLGVLGFDAAMQELQTEVDTGFAVTVLEEGGRICAERLHPINREGDEHGCQLVDGTVRTPPGMATAYRDFADAGLTSLSADPAHGGQGLPFLLQLWLDEMISAANLSFGLFTGLTRSATEAIVHHASEDLKAIYLEPLVGGAWTGVMVLTESGAGTDLALPKTKAASLGDGSYSRPSSRPPSPISASKAQCRRSRCSEATATFVNGVWSNMCAMRASRRFTKAQTVFRRWIWSAAN